MRTSAIARMVVISVLALGLLIPLAWVYALVAERASRRDQAAAEIGQTWGGSQQVSAPLLTIPYTVVRVNDGGVSQRSVYRAVILARDVQIDGTVRAETRARGIFRAVVYHAQLKISGTFAASDLNSVHGEGVDWTNASIHIGIADPRGLTQRTTVSVNGHDVPMSGGVGDVGLFAAGLHADVPAGDRPEATSPSR